MILHADRSLPELQSLSTGQYDAIFYSLVVAGFALFASFLYSWTSRSEVSVRYRGAVLASLCITGVASVAYIVLVVKFDSGYDLVRGRYVPNDEARLTVAPRYMDWSVTVPLLTAELLAVCTAVGAKARSLRLTTMSAAFLMIITGYVGAKLVEDGTDVTALVVWGIISSIFFLYLYVALAGAVGTSVKELSPEAGHTLRNAAILLLSVFGVYPLVYAIPVFFNITPTWATIMIISFSAADVAAKAGFGALIHKVAKLRTAEDVNAGVDTHPDPVWISNVHYSDGIQPELKVHSRDGRRDHERLVDDGVLAGSTATRSGATVGRHDAARGDTIDLTGPATTTGRESGGSTSAPRD